MIPPVKAVHPQGDDPAAHDDGPATNEQLTELRALADKHGEPFDGNLNARQAQERIEYLKGLG